MKLFLGICLVGLSLLSLRLFLFFSTPLPFTPEREVFFEATLLSVPEEKPEYQSFSVIANGQFRVFIIAKKTIRLSYGDKIGIKGVFKERKDDRGRVWYSVSANEVRVLSSSPFLSSLITFQQEVKQRMSYFLSSDHVGLLTGITFGVNQPLTPSLKEAIRSTGVSHITVASGMNVTLLAGLLMSLFLRVTRRQTAILLSIGVLILYFFFAGAQASILRATIMGSITLLGGVWGRQTRGVWLLCLAGYGMVIFQPFLLFDLGFQLSFLSTLGILLYQPFLERYIKGIVGISDLLITFCAQILTLPVLLFTFGQLNFFSLLTNTLVLWMMPLLMLVGGVSGGVSLVFPLLGSLIATLSVPFLWFFTQVVLFFAPFSLTVEIDSIFFSIGWYLLAVWLYLVLYRNSYEKTSSSHS